MKTFEEAARIIDPQNPEQLEAFYSHYMCLSDDVKTCKPLAKLITAYHGEMRICCERHVRAELAAAAKAFFHYGLAVGIEMTKPDAS
jgi:hypothetical protein